MNHIILDMDETLICMDNLHEPVSRPFLEDFLVFCFENFKSVSIWTSACSEWFEIVNKNIFLPILKKYNLKFRFTWTFKKCTPIKKVNSIHFNIYYVYIKELEKVWNNYNDMNMFNTLILDDNYESFKNNIENAIHIKNWDFEDYEDKELIKTMNLLKKLHFSTNVLLDDKNIE